MSGVSVVRGTSTRLVVSSGGLMDKNIRKKVKHIEDRDVSYYCIPLFFILEELVLTYQVEELVVLDLRI